MHTLKWAKEPPKKLSVSGSKVLSPSVRSSHQEESDCKAAKNFSKVFQSGVRRVARCKHSSLHPPARTHSLLQPTPGSESLQTVSRTKQAASGGAAFPTPTQQGKVKRQESVLMSAPRLSHQCCTYPEARMAGRLLLPRLPAGTALRLLSSVPGCPGLRRKQAAPSRPASRRRPPRSDVRRLGARDIYG